MLILTHKIWLFRLQYEIKIFSYFDSLESHLRLTKASVLCHEYTINIMYQYSTPSTNMIQSHPACYLSVRVIACVTSSIRSLRLFNMPIKQNMNIFRNKEFYIYYPNAHYKKVYRITRYTQKLNTAKFQTQHSRLKRISRNWLSHRISNHLVSGYILNRHLLYLYGISYEVIAPLDMFSLPIKPQILNELDGCYVVTQQLNRIIKF